MLFIFIHSIAVLFVQVMLNSYFFIQASVTSVFPVLMNFVWMYRFRKHARFTPLVRSASHVSESELLGDVIEPQTPRSYDSRDSDSSAFRERELNLLNVHFLPGVRRGIRSSSVSSAYSRGVDGTYTPPKLPFEVVLTHPQYRRLLREYLVELSMYTLVLRFDSLSCMYMWLFSSIVLIASCDV